MAFMLETFKRQPIVILGGFLSSSSLYEGMRRTLVTLAEQPVLIVPARSHEWMGTATPLGWSYILRKLERTVHRAARDSLTGQITLVGHSTGGVMARLFLAPEPFKGHCFQGTEYVNHLITLGSPHYNRHGGWMRRWVENKYPGAFFAPQVRYISVAGAAIRGKSDGTTKERAAYFAYRLLGTSGNMRGDGLVPLESALLDGSQHVVLPDASHFARSRGVWYGTERMVHLWWQAAMSAQETTLRGCDTR